MLSGPRSLMKYDACRVELLVLNSVVNFLHVMSYTCDSVGESFLGLSFQWYMRSEREREREKDREGEKSVSSAQLKLSCPASSVHPNAAPTATAIQAHHMAQWWPAKRLDCPVEGAYMGNLSCNSGASRCDSEGRHGVVVSDRATSFEAPGCSVEANRAVQRGVLAQGHQGLYHQGCHRDDVQESRCCCCGDWCHPEGLETQHHPQQDQSHSAHLSWQVACRC